MNNEDIKEDIKVLEDFLDKQDRKFVSKDRLNFLQAIENLINKNKELETINKIQEYRISVIDERELIPKSKVREVLDTKYMVMFEGNTEFPDDATIMKTVKFVKVSDIEALLQEGDK